MIKKIFNGLSYCHFWQFCLVGMMIRILFLVWFLSTTSELNYGPLAGETYHQAGVDGYLQIASTLLKTGEYAFEPGGGAVPFRPPVQPVLMLIFGAWSPDHWYVAWFFGALLIWLATMLVAREIMKALSVGHVWKNGAYLVLVLFPYSIFTIKTPGLVVTLTLIMTFFAFSWLRFISFPTRLTAVMTGLISGVACLTHGIFLPLCLIGASVGFLVGFPHWRGMVPRLLLAGGIAMLIVMPWTLRNFLQFKKFIPVATGGGFQYWIADKAYFEEFKSVGQMIDEMRQEFLLDTGRELRIEHWGIMDPKDEEWFSRKAADQVKNDPWIIARRLGVGLYSFWAPIDRGWRKSLQLGLLNLPLLIAGCVGLFLCLKKRSLGKSDLLFAALLGGYITLFALIQSISGYYIAIIPIIICWVASLWSRSCVLRPPFFIHRQAPGAS